MILFHKFEKTLDLLLFLPYFTIFEFIFILSIYKFIDLN
ncbi:hypothetical protein LEP1GSC115_4184 [Leptospira interrogans serovar Australis str. 200703203]|uniref:Uncharacterized protein n=1 Tax=Leptospira interrogans serovar Australis str. 200703203 TaxID=1085541 RepID=N1UJN5_LEPIR|nr:hypothetical protein LEP1GSC115_4184 [Leptospira interrogans serovar Australis str. 200703203]